MHFLSFKAIVTSSQRMLYCGLSQNLVCESPWLPMHNPPYCFGVFGELSEKGLSPQTSYDTFIEKAPRIYLLCDFY